jgi:hypothetical protein
MLLIFVALRNLSLSGGFEPANLGSNGKQANHYTTENDRCQDNIKTGHREVEGSVWTGSVVIRLMSGCGCL